MVSLVAQRLAGGNFGAEYCILQFGGHGPYQLKIQILSSGRPGLLLELRRPAVEYGLRQESSMVPDSGSAPEAGMFVNVFRSSIFSNL